MKKSKKAVQDKSITHKPDPFKLDYSSKAGLQVVKRCTTLFNLVLSGFALHEMRAFAFETWGISQDTFENYMKQVRVWFNENCRKERAEKINESVGIRRELLKKAIAAGDLKLANEILSEMDRFQNLYPAVKMKHEFGNGLADFLMGKKIEGMDEHNDRPSGEIREAELVDAGDGAGPASLPESQPNA